MIAEIEAEIIFRDKGQVIGDYRADPFVNRCVLVELKTASNIESRDEAELFNELKATGIKVGLLINFGRQKAEFKRLVFRPFGVLIFSSSDFSVSFGGLNCFLDRDQSPCPSSRSNP